MSIHIIGMGMGSPGTLTTEAHATLEAADVVIGAERLLAALPPSCGAQKIAAVSADEILRHIDAAASQAVAVLMSGDTGFYSGASRLIARLGTHAAVLPGLSSVSYFAARLLRPWQDWKLVSAHGKQLDAAGLVSGSGETFFLTGGELTVRALCARLVEAGLGGLRVTVGENLGAGSERVKTGTAGELALSDHDMLAVMLVDNPNPGQLVSCGIPDDMFLRGGTPMTKSEVRSVILSKLRLRDSDTVYDVGAGTGSVSVEAALLVNRGTVYAFEREPEGCRLIGENAAKFGVSNLTVIAGEAPGSFSGLPAPDAVFIGGSGGGLREIMDDVLRRNPRARLVISAVTLETLSEAAALFSALPVRDTEVVQLSVSRARLMGSHRLLTAQNPVFLLSGTGGRR